MGLPQQPLLKLSEWLAVIATIMGVVVAVLTFSAGDISKKSASVVEIISPRIDNLESRYARLDSDIKSLKDQIQSLTNIPDQAKLAVQLRGIDNAMIDLKARHSRLEEAILNNPTKAIEVPLLRKDLDNLKDNQQQSLVSLKQGIDQVYDLNKWLLGAMAVSVLTLAISNVLRGREKQSPAD